MTDAPPELTQSGQPLTIDFKGEAPKNRFTSAAALFNCFTQSLQESILNDQRLTDIRSCYDGYPMDLGDISEEQLRNNGNLPNINRREFTRMIDDYAGNYVAIDTGADMVVDIRVKRKYCQSASQKASWEQALSEFFTDAVKEWDPECKSMADFVMESGSRNTQMGLFGIGCAYFRDSVDWRFIMVPTRCVIVPTGTKITLRNHSILYVRRTYTATEMWKKRNEHGWNTEYVTQMLYERLAENMPGTTNRIPFSEWENTMRNNDPFLQRDFRQLFMVECFVQEFADGNGKGAGVSKYVLMEQGANSEFLYEGDREYKSIKNAIVTFVDNPGPESDWHGVKGYGDMLYDLATQNNLVWNHLCTMGIIVSSPMFMCSSEEERRKLEQMVWSRFGIANPGLTLATNNVKVDLNAVSAIMESGERLINETGRNFPQGETVGGVEKTATQSTFDQQDRAQLSSRQINMYRSVGLDSQFTEMYRRLANQSYPEAWGGGKAAKNFRDKCKEAGIPVQAYVDIEEVRASRRGGTGNSALDVQRGQMVLSVASPGRGQAEAKKAIIAAAAGWDQVTRFYDDVPPQDSDDVTMTLENADLTDGQLVSAFSFQNHLKHLGTPDPSGPGHISVLASLRPVAMQLELNDVKNNIDDAQKVSRAMDATLRHCGQHMDWLGQQLQYARNKDLEAAVKQLGKVLATFGQFIQHFDMAVAKAVQATQGQQNGQQPPVEQQIKWDEWQTRKQIMLQESGIKMHIDSAKQNQKLGERAETHQAKMMASQQSHDQKLGQQAESTLVQNQISKAQTAVEIAAQAAQNIQQIHHNTATHVQGLVQGTEQHAQDMAQTRAEHNQKLVQQQEQAQADQQNQPDDNGPSTPNP